MGAPRLRPGFCGAPVIMGILNITEDSFSDGGKYLDPESAVRQATRMLEDGASIVDIGAESSRPGSIPVAESVQLQRIIPVLKDIRGKLDSGITISVDTRSAKVAAAALDAGADWINDISAGRDDPELLPLLAKRRSPVVLMHMQGNPGTMQDNPQYSDVLNEVREFLQDRVAAAKNAGMAAEDIMVDPGIGFGKSREHNLQLLRGLPQLVADGVPVLLGTSRKRFMGSLCNESEPQKLLGATCASTVFGSIAGVRVFRVHDVLANRQAIQIATALKAQG